MRIFAVLKSLCERMGIYNRLRYSPLYYRVLRYKNPGFIAELAADRAFYARHVGTSLDLVFDVGANCGEKTHAFKHLARRVVSVEPDTASFQVLCTRFGHDKAIHLENVALADRPGTATFYVQASGSCYNTLSPKQKAWLVEREPLARFQTRTVQVSTLDALIEKYGRPDFLKIDVEGYELPVIEGLNHPVPIICFEANLPHFLKETLQIIDRLSRDSAVAFNLRVGDRFVFPRHVQRDQLEAALKTDCEVSYDVFVYREDARRERF
jgi:FkbM family methyltransferase